MTWQDVLKKNYLRNKCLSQVIKRRVRPHFWVGLMDAKDLLLKKRRLKVNSGNQTVFREDLWTVHEPLKLKFLDLTE